MLFKTLFLGVGLVHLSKPYDGECIIKLPLGKNNGLTTRILNENVKVYVLSFKDPKCQYEHIVGGKGASLAQLSAIETSEVISSTIMHFPKCYIVRNTQNTLNKLSFTVQSAYRILYNYACITSTYRLPN